MPTTALLQGFPLIVGRDPVLPELLVRAKNELVVTGGPVKAPHRRGLLRTYPRCDLNIPQSLGRAVAVPSTPQNCFPLLPALLRAEFPPFQSKLGRGNSESDSLPCSWEFGSSQRKLRHFGRVLCTQVFLPFFSHSSPETEGAPLPSSSKLSQQRSYFFHSSLVCGIG